MKIGFVSLGCPKNLVDGEVMLGYARDAGYEITPAARDADVIVVNTCAFIDNAKQESIDTILEMAQQKRDGKCSRLVVTGCLAERYRDELRKEIPEIDALLGTGELPDIVEALGSMGDGRGSMADARWAMGDGSGTTNADIRPLTFHKKNIGHRTSRIAHGTPPTYLYDASTPRVLTTPRHFAYVKIAEGCDYTCAFCIIPTLRGGYRSRTQESIVAEARGLAERGVKELLLISQDTTFYGVDRQQRGALAKLLRDLNGISGLEWIRLLYLYPTTITDDVLAAMAECDKVCRYVDLPLQHASADVLKRMRRPGTRKTYDRLLARIRDRVPGVTLRTTFIVGFPGETDQDFAELEAFVEDTEFDHIGVFTYSHEEGTRAYAVRDDVPAATKRKRREHLMTRQRRIVAARQQARIGSDVRVLIDGPSPEHELVLQGRLEGQAPDIDPVVYLTDADPSECTAGRIVFARIVAARGYDLVATPMMPRASRGQGCAPGLAPGLPQQGRLPKGI
jgi:ribosomal protein S12 methylthiotransferase